MLRVRVDKWGWGADDESRQQQRREPIPKGRSADLANVLHVCVLALLPEWFACQPAHCLRPGVWYQLIKATQLYLVEALGYNSRYSVAFPCVHQVCLVCVVRLLATILLVNGSLLTMWIVKWGAEMMYIFGIWGICRQACLSQILRRVPQCECQDCSLNTNQQRWFSHWSL